MSTVLLIEPHPESARRYADHLDRAGFRVEAVSAEAQRQELLRPDLVIVSVPQLDRRQLQIIANGQAVPKIALTSVAADVDRGSEFGFAAVLVRPVMYDDLVNEVRRVLKTVEEPA